MESYLAFSVPAIVVGFGAPRIGLLPATYVYVYVYVYVYGGAVIALALGSLAARWPEPKGATDDGQPSAVHHRPPTHPASS